MVLFNYSTKELTAKVVYYGAGLCGKTTNLQWIHEQLPIKNKGKMLSLATEADRTLFFDFLPIELGTIRGMKTRVQLYTVPGQVFYNATRRMVLKGADCVVFVADSQDAMIEANADAMKNLRENLVANELDPDTIPLVIQYNKRDLPNAAPLDVLNKALNARGVPFVEASAKSGKGVEETLKVATQLVFKVLAGKYGNDAAPRNSESIQRPPRVAAPPPPVRPTSSMNPPPSFTSTDDLLDSLGGPPSAKPPAPSLSLDSELDLGPAPPNSSAGIGDPLDALSGLGGASAPSPTVDPFGPELSLDSLGPSPAPAGDLELDLGPPPAPAGPGDPFGPTLDMEFGAPSPAPPSALEDPFGSALEPGSPFDGGVELEMPPPPPGGSSSFTSDPVSVEASVTIPASSLKADLVEISVPVDLTMSGGAQDVLIPIRLQLKIRIR